MKMHKIIITCLMLTCFIAMSAQTEEKTETVFNHHWYIQGQFGAQYTLGEISFGDLISPNAQIAAGYQFTPEFGTRLSVNMWQSKAGSELFGNKYKWSWYYVAPGVDAVFNISNLTCGYNPNRVFNFSVFAGLGANMAWKNGEAWAANTQIAEELQYEGCGDLEYIWDRGKTRLYGRIGTDFDFKVNDVITLGLELQATTLNDHYNSKKADNADWYFNALAGIKVNLGKATKTKTVCVPAQEIKIIEKIVEKPVEKIVTVEKIVEKPVKETVEQFRYRCDVFFNINSAEILPAEKEKLKKLVDYLNQNKEVEVSLVGYADKGTGTSKINEILAEKRVNAVSNMLQTEFGVSSSRIKKLDSKGDRIQPFIENDKNRATICVVE